ncbi:MAG: nucleoside triphosphate pyrophosphohydrolase [Woeseia sp.]
MSSIEKLLDLMARLRDPQTGCPWDLQQDFASLAPYTVEEAYEVVDAIRREDLRSLRDELGDLLLQVVFHSRVAEEKGAFNFDDVASGIAGKMLRRHPHVFGSAAERQRGAVEGSWEHIKATERREVDQEASTLDGVARSLPALMRAQKLGKRAARAGFDWPDAAGPAAKIAEELAELQEALAGGSEADAAEELGDLLFAAASLARHLGADAEEVLASANRKFERRFRLMEEQFRERGAEMADLDIDTLEKEWQAVKSR